MKQTTELTPTMLAVLATIKAANGTISRFPGGFWKTDILAPKSYGTTTINALEKRGYIEWTDMRRHSFDSGEFPIKAKLTNKPLP